MSGVVGRSGRKPKPPGQKQEHVIGVRFTGEEVALVFKAGHERRMKLATLMREIILRDLRRDHAP